MTSRWKLCFALGATVLPACAHSNGQGIWNAEPWDCWSANQTTIASPSGSVTRVDRHYAIGELPPDF